jgi:mannitol 2-dehydrogenase
LWVQGSRAAKSAKGLRLFLLFDLMSIDIMKLSESLCASLPERIVKPTYDRTATEVGMVHFGVGGFHRAHQAIYTEALLNQGKAGDWRICGAGVRTADRQMRDALAKQDFLYTLYELGDTDDLSIQVVGVIKDCLVVQDQGDALLAMMSAPSTRIVSLTVTEGGYYTDDSTGEFKTDHPDILADLKTPKTPATVFGLIAEALSRRRDAGIGPFTVMSCDNLPHNGNVVRKAVLGYAALRDQNLHDWIADTVTFPNAMVDRITPMTSDAHKAQLQQETGIEDEWPVVAEPFLQWVVEDKFCAGRPEWEEVGVQFTDDVTPYEEMKIGLLNGAHLAMTYLGTLLGYQYAHETMEDPILREYVRLYMDEDVTPRLKPVPGIDLTEYKDTLIERFSNRAICDQLARICSDGFSKFPKFVFPTLRRQIKAGVSLDRTALIVAAWTHYLKGQDEKGQTYSMIDPKMDLLKDAIKEDDTAVDRMLALEDVFGEDLPKSADFIEAYQRQLTHLRQHGVHATLKQLLEQTQ